MALPKHCTALDDRAIAPFLATAKSGIPEDAQCVAFRGSASQHRNDLRWILLNSFSVSCSGLSLSLIMRRGSKATARDWLCNRSRAAEQRDERAALHSITSSARLSSAAGTVRPSILAVWALMTSSNLVDCSTGRSAGLTPLRMRPV